MATFLRADSDDNSEPFALKSKDSEPTPSPLAQDPGEEERKEEPSKVAYETLEQFRASPSAKDVNFTIKYFPFQLYPDMSNAGEDKYEWYKRERYNNSPEQMEKYTTVMTAYGRDVGIDFNFNGIIANTIHAHRLLQHTQEHPPKPDSTSLLLSSLYTSYFHNGSHPSSPATLFLAARAAGMELPAAEAFIGDEYEELPEVKMLLQEQRGNGVDSVPFVTVEGRKRDFTLEGAKEVGEYLAILEKVAGEV